MSMNNPIKKHPADKAIKRKQNQLSGFEKSQTQQNSRDAVDVNKLMAKYRKTGLLDHVNTHEGNYGDFSTHTDFAESMNKVVKATEAFEQLPSEIRKDFNNDTAEFLKFVHDPKNGAKMYEMGLAIKPQEAPTYPTVNDPLKEPVKAPTEVSEA